MHDEAPLLVRIERARLASRFAYFADAALFDAVLDRMVAAKQIELADQGVTLKGRGPQLSKKQRQLLDQIIGSFLQAGFQPPSINQLQKQAESHRGSIGELIDLASAQGSLVKIQDNVFLHADCERQMRGMVVDALSQKGGLTVSEIREILGTTRKYAVPFCEYLDRVGVTRREGDQRVLAEVPGK
jgi:selenocysteine-specific elongation factor